MSKSEKVQSGDNLHRENNDCSITENMNSTKNKVTSGKGDNQNSSDCEFSNESHTIESSKDQLKESVLPSDEGVESIEELSLKNNSEQSSIEIEQFDENNNSLEKETTKFPIQTNESEKDSLKNGEEKNKENIEVTNDQNPENQKTYDKKYRAKNGQVGVPYAQPLNELYMNDINLSNEINLHCVNACSLSKKSLQDIGLEFDEKKFEIKGTPKLAGNFNFILEYGFNSKTEKKIENPRPQSIQNRSLNILINPDPSSLWKKLDPAEDLPFPKKHFEFENFEYQGFKIYGASIRGRSHAHTAMYRDDHFEIKNFDEDILVLAVADGAGSAEYSREGSRLACEACKKSLLDNKGKVDLLKKLIYNYDKSKNNELSNLAYDIIGDIIQKAIRSIDEISKREKSKLRDFATTLLLALVAPTEKGYCIISYSIGDGIIAKLDDENNPQLLTTPDSGIHAGQTKFITMKESIHTISDRTKIRFVSSLKNLFLMTDGISDVYFETESQFNKTECWNKLISEIEEEIDFSGANVENQFEKWIDFFSRGNHDDRTIIWIR